MKTHMSRLLATCGLNGLILGELTLSMYLSHGKGDEMPGYFLMVFLPMVLITIGGGGFLVRRFFAQGGPHGES
jgi:hypothetical protein